MCGAASPRPAGGPPWPAAPPTDASARPSPPLQLVLYPVVDLASGPPWRRDLRWWLRGLEETALVAMAEASGLTGVRVKGRTGAWVGDPPNQAKLAAVGVAARRWTTYHGLSLNVCCPLEPFSGIVPCGIGDAPVGTVCTALAGGVGSLLSPSGTTGRIDLGGLAAAAWPREGDRGVGRGREDALLDEYRWAMREGFERAFGVGLVEGLRPDEDAGAGGVENDDDAAERAALAAVYREAVARPDPWRRDRGGSGGG